MQRCYSLEKRAKKGEWSEAVCIGVFFFGFFVFFRLNFSFCSSCRQNELLRLHSIEDTETRRQVEGGFSTHT